MAASPAALIAPGERTGKYRTGTDRLVTDAQGENRISMEDHAVAMIDELQQPKHIRQRFTVAYCRCHAGLLGAVLDIYAAKAA